MGHFQCPYGDELPGMSWLDPVPESVVGTNQGVHISISLYHWSLLCCSLTVGTKRSYRWSLNTLAGPQAIQHYDESFYQERS